LLPHITKKLLSPLYPHHAIKRQNAGLSKTALPAAAQNAKPALKMTLPGQQKGKKVIETRDRFNV